MHEPRDDSRPRVGAVRTVLLLLAYAGVVCALTWPLARDADRTLPLTNPGCFFDTPLAGWAMAHATRKLVAAPTTVFEAAIYHPTPHAFGYGISGFGALPLFAPVFLVTENPTLALNAVLLGGVVLTAFTLHLVVFWWTGSHLGGAVAAATFLGTRWVLWEWLPVAPTYAALWWFPLLIYLAAAPRLSTARAGLLAVLVALQGLADQVYVAPAVVAPLVVLAAWRLARPATRPTGLRLLGAVAGGVALLLPSYVGHLLVRAENPSLARQSVWSTSPTELLPGIEAFVVDGLVLPRADLATWFFNDLSPAAIPFVALVTIVVGLALRVRRRDRADGLRAAMAHGALWTLVGLMMALPPTIVGPHAEPVRLLHLTEPWLGIPLYALFRQTQRFAVAALMGASIMSGASVAALSRLGARALGPTLAAALVAVPVLGGIALEYHDRLRPALRARYPRMKAIESQGLIMVLLSAGRGPVLELPVGHGLQPRPHAEAMYRAIFHRRPLVNGYGSYWPAGFDQRMQLALRLPEPPALEALREQTGLTHILVHLSPELPQVDAWAAIAQRRVGSGLRVVMRERDSVLFAVMPATAPSSPPPGVRDPPAAPSRSPG